MVFAAFRTLAPRPLPLAVFTLAGLDAVTVPLSLAGIRALIGLFIGALRGPGLGPGFRPDFPGDFAGDLAGDFLACGLEPLAAAARICFLVSADGRLRGEFLAGEAGAAFAVSAFRRGPRTAALILAAVFTLGSLMPCLETVLPRPVVAAFFAAAFPRAVVALVMAFLTLALIDLGVIILRFFPPRALVLSSSTASFRFVPVIFLFFFTTFFSSTILGR